MRIIPAMGMNVEDRADRLLEENLSLIEGAWIHGKHAGMGMRYVLAVEILRPDDTALAFRPAPWPSPLLPGWPWRADEIVVVFLLEEGAVVRTTPAPIE